MTQIIGLDGKPLEEPADLPIRARFVPQEDITAYELAILLPYYLGLKQMFVADWSALGAINRHLERVNKSTA